ncbi:MAG TPA: tyrosine-type recombinase/integrase, partial [Anaerolineales bacterium]|nr:tyrosine-type recombinase/integrase [Anaerolineales bacterium]
VRIHDLRHYFVTMTYLAKGNLKLSQELARHESINTTNRYAHLNAETAKAYDEIFNKRMK